MTIFDLLHASHEIQRGLCRQLTAARANAVRREAIFLQLKLELEAHAAAEERFLYCPVLLTDAGLSVSRHALSEHHEIEELCDELSVRDKSGADWMETAKQLTEKVRHHLKEEETKFFKVAGRVLDDRQKDLLAKRYQKDLLHMRKKLAADYATVGVSPEGLLAPAG